MDNHTASARRLYHHLQAGGTMNGSLDASAMSGVVKGIERKDASIAELEAEVERLKRDKAKLHDTLEKVFAEAANQWNDAIEAAAIYTKDQYGMGFLFHPVDRDRIRALKKGGEE